MLNLWSSYNRIYPKDWTDMITAVLEAEPQLPWRTMVTAVLEAESQLPWRTQWKVEA